MKESPLVSVIIPVYNVEKYIVKCLESVVSQDIEANIELIVIDDCGTDNSILKVRDYAKKIEKSDRNIKIVSHFQNKGSAAARNTGVRMSTGKFLYFLDSDDSLPVNALKLLLDYSSYTNANIIQGQSISFSEDGKKISKLSIYNNSIIEGDSLWRIGTSWMPVAWNKLINKDFFIKNNLWFFEGFNWEDLAWSYHVALANPKIFIVQDYTYNYLIRKSSISRTMSEYHVDSFIQMVEVIKDLYVNKAKKLNSSKKAFACYERFRSIAIDYVYPKCPEWQRNKLFKSLSMYKVESFWFLLLNRDLDFRIKTKVLPLYFKSFGHYIIKLKSSLIKLIK